MSEKRFYRASVCGDDGLYDKEDGCIIVNVWSNIDLDDNWNTVVEKLNELADENRELRQELEENKSIINFCSNGDEDEDLHRLIKENEQLRQELQEMKSDEKLYANEILELNKTKKEILNFKQLGGDY